MCTNHSFLLSIDITNSEITEYHFLLYVIIVLNSVEFLVLQCFWGIQSHTSQHGHPSTIQRGTVRVGITGLVSIRHSWTSLEWSKSYFCVIKKKKDIQMCMLFFLSVHNVET